VIIDLVGPDEIGARLEVRSNTVSTWRARGLLPAPVAVVSRVPLWPWPVIRAWADATGRLGSHREAPKVSRDEVSAARAVVLAELDALADEAIGILDLCGVSAMIRKASAREAMRHGSGRFRSLDGRGNYAGEWDWYFQLSQRDRDWLARSHQGPEPHLSAPDQVTECMAKFTGTVDTDRCMAEWLRCVRIIDAAGAIHKRVPWRRCAHLFTGVVTSYDIAALFGTYAEAASYLAGLREEPSDDEEPRALIARLGPSPLDMDFDAWRDELRELEARASSIEYAGEWEVPCSEDQAILDRLEELLPSAVAGVVTGSLEDLYVAVVGAYLETVA
jgi:hypothetical protein